MTLLTAQSLLGEIEDVGRDEWRGGYSRHIFTGAERELREWFVERAERLGLGIEIDRNSNMWAWWGTPGPDAVVTGSHLDSVPGGGAHDGPLGVATAFEAVSALQSEGFEPRRPIAIVVFAEEEGSRFGIACLGSRLLTGDIDPARAAALSDSDGRLFGDVASDAGFPDLGADRASLRRIGVFVELHVEQGKGLIGLDSEVAVATSIMEHGRWRLDIEGEGNHAGTTDMAGRHDPMIPAAQTVLAARAIANSTAGLRATVGRLEPLPGGTNVIASHVRAWVDLRSPDPGSARARIDQLRAVVAEAAADEGCIATLTEESFTGEVRFDPTLRDRLADTLGGVPLLATGAGHDAGILAGHVPTAMLFVRNPSGISHAPAEAADDAAIVAGARALTAALKGLS